MALARPAAQAQFVFVAIAFFSLMGSFIGHDFSVLNVASTPTPSCRWPTASPPPGAATRARCCCGCSCSVRLGVAVSLLSSRLPLAMVARVLGTMGFVAVGFLLFILLTSNPFRR
jgi:cytochrome c-type biogenesis protein CcmF